MMRRLLAAASLAVMIAGVPAFAQQQAPAAQAEAQLVGLPVYSSDGVKLGEVTDVGTVGDQQMVRAEMGTFLGLGSSLVVIPAQMFERKTDRIEVAMSAGEVKETISKQ